ncbi:hypothetical protein QUF80_23700 [Desulfococcaceae bacterium HSG8]|nr:hypothetical protein [Desulfococcaceae bacterium HSG8]
MPLIKHFLMEELFTWLETLEELNRNLSEDGQPLLKKLQINNISGSGNGFSCSVRRELSRLTNPNPAAGDL